MAEPFVTIDGLRVVCSVGRAKKPLPPHNNRFEIVEQSNWFPRRHQCGHRGARWFRLHTYGVETKKIYQWDLCPECFLADAKKYIIQCALCGLPIMPGMAVALYGSGPGLKMEIATVLEGGAIVGCLRSDCCPSGGFFAGHWTEQGFKPAFDSGLSTAAEAMATGTAVAANT